MKIKIGNTKIDILLLFVSAYMIFPFELRAVTSVQSLVVQLFIILYILYRYKMVYSLMINKSGILHNTYFLIFVWGLLAVFSLLINASSDLSYLLGPYKNMISWYMHFLIIFLLIMKRSNRRDDYLEEFMKVYILSVILYVMFTCLILVIPGLREHIYNTINMTDKVLSDLKYSNFRTRIGWAGFTVYDGGLKCALASCFCFSLMLKRLKKKIKIEKGIIVGLFFSILGSLFYSRTAVVITIVCFLWYGFSLMSKLKRGNEIIKYIMLIGLMGIAFWVFVSNYSGDNSAINWMLEVIINKKNTGAVSSLSLDMLEKMYYVPSFDTMLTGDGRYTAIQGGYYGKTDVGFMRYLLYFGLAGTVIIYTIVLYPIIKLGKIINDSYGTMLVQMLIILIIGFELKGESVQFYFPISMILLIISIYDKKYNHN